MPIVYDRPLPGAVEIEGIGQPISITSGDWKSGTLTPNDFQAVRIMVPQLNSQYLNIIKSTTLGAAVAYPEILQIFAGTVMNQSGKEVEIIIIVMAVFLVINLIFSAFMNWYNARVALVRR